jgi:hypothetical protein
MANKVSLELSKAIEAGDMFYFTGKPCKRGHVAPRYTKTHSCLNCGKEVYIPKDNEKYRTTNNTLYRQYITRKRSAKEKGIPFTIKFEQIEQPTHCPILGIELNYKWSGKNRRDSAKASIDKVDPSKGYILGNVFVISWRANKLKSDMSLQELENILKYIKERL